MPSALPFRIGTRSSPLALAQAEAVRAALAAAHRDLAAEGAVEIVPIRTAGDRITDRPLADIGGKGLFTEAIETALQDGRIAVAAHSVKDLPTRLPDGMEIGCLLPREDPRDVLVARGANSLADLPQRAVVGTASLRRKAQLLALRPDLSVVNFRGNVQTRLRKLEEGAVDATLLALAGLRRLGMAEAATAVLSPEEMLPAVGQGAIGLEIRADDEATRRVVAELDHGPTRACVTAERAVLEALDGSCTTPIGVLAEIAADGTLALRALLAAPDGSAAFHAVRSGPAIDARASGLDAGMELRAAAGSEFCARLGLGPGARKG